MTSDADFDVLRHAGISEEGIDFVSKLLNKDPFGRPTEKECFQHPWIATVPDVDDYEDDDDLLSERHDGLSIIGEDPEDELDASQLSIADGPGYAQQADDEEQHSSEALAKKPRIEYIPSDVRYPSLPKIESFQDGQAIVDKQARRLFGEVSSSALQSSHALGNFDAYDFDHIQIEEYVSSGESLMSEDPSDSIISLPENPFGGTAPSLMGAEKLVGDLKMNSLHSIMHFKGGAVNESSTRQTSPRDAQEPTSPRSPSLRNQDSVPPTSSPQETPKAKFTRRIDLAVPDTASEASSDNSPQNSHDASAPETSIKLRKSMYDPELATTLDAQTGEAILEQFREESEPSEPIVHQPSIHPDSFAKPPRRFGKLKSLPGSIFDLKINLENRLTSWGRGPLASVQHTDITDTRIPAYALELTFWAPGIEPKIAIGENWQKIPGIMAIISTKARMGIYVNDTLLQRGPPGEDGPNQYPFGKLYNGDIITVYKHKKKFLKLQCEFTFGDSAQPRPADEPFTVRQVLMTKGGAMNRMPTRPARKDRDRD
jgi:serine/threonine protein kinase